jgi:DNA modification methylase
MAKSINKNMIEPFRTDKQLELLIKKYERNQRPISVDFRKMVPNIKTDRYTHLIHPYPAKLLVHIPYFFLANTILSKPGDTVLDPFCGSGTVLLEGKLSEREIIGADINPLARLISKVKLIPLSEKQLRNKLNSILKSIPHKSCSIPPDVVNIDYWYYPHVTKQLLCIFESIKKLDDNEIKDFFLVCFSCCARKVSLADPRLTVPVRLREGQYPKGHWLREKTDAYLRKLRRINVIKVFENIVEQNIQRMSLFGKIYNDCSQPILCNDAKALMTDDSLCGNKKNNLIPDNSVQLVITSPPYSGAQKYIRSTSLNMGWLGFCSASELITYKEATIGREEYHKDEYQKHIDTGILPADNILKKLRKINPLRSHITSNYLIEMQEAMKETARVLKPKGYLLLVTANNQICGREFRTPIYLKTIVEKLGFSLKLCLIDDIKSRGLMTKRNKTASIITREWGMLFQKD